MSIKIRDFRVILKSCGAQLVRESKHQIWRLPSGHNVVLAYGNGEVSEIVLKSARKAFKVSGLEVPF